MKRLGFCLALLGLTGCVSNSPIALDAKGPAPTSLEQTVRVPVRPDQVTANNAHKQSQALWDELDRDVQQRLTP